MVMKINKTEVVSWICVIGLIILLFRGCNPPPEQPKPKEVKNTFTTKVIEHTKIDTLYLTKIVKTKDVKLINDIANLYKENQNLINLYENETDSLKRILMYKDAVKLNEFNKEFKDDKINAKISGVVQGEVKLLNFEYTYKEPSFKNPSRLIVGGGIGNDIKFNNPIFKAGFGFQSRKGNSLIFSYDNNKNIYVDYYISLIKF